MRNALRYVLDGLEECAVSAAKGHIFLNIKAAQQHFMSAEQRIRDYGATKVLRGMVIYTHCHSSAVVSVLQAAMAKGKRFAVRNTETRPSFQGRITAAQLAKLGIPVEHYVDSAARYALQKADLVLFGADAVTAEGAVVNKVGTRIMAELAGRHDIPVYVCTDSWKFDPRTVSGVGEEIEMRHPDEVWPGRPRGVTVRNYAFESVEPDLVNGIISELGIFRPEVFVEEVKDAHPWMFRP
jgi:ribose 1,5-bisphosphate isomerase